MFLFSVGLILEQAFVYIFLYLVQNHLGTPEKDLYSPVCNDFKTVQMIFNCLVIFAKLHTHRCCVQCQSLFILMNEPKAPDIFTKESACWFHFSLDLCFC